MSILITGASGFLGTALTKRLLEKGHRIYGLSRHPHEEKENFIPLVGDITETNLGLGTVPKDIDCIYHLAGSHHLGEDKDGQIWRTNVEGTENVLDFCVSHDIPKLYFTSTAYTLGANPYELSKIKNEEAINHYKDIYGLKVTIFKPSVVLGTETYFYPGHFSQFVSLVIKIHQRAELIRRKIEGTLRLPIIEPVFRVKGNPKGKANLIRVDTVVEAIATIDKEGTFWLTNSNPPTLGRLFEWVGEFIMVRIKLEPEFKPTPIEATFQKMTSAFEPYAQGDNFPSDLKQCPRITKSFIQNTIKQALG